MSFIPSLIGLGSSVLSLGSNLLAKSEAERKQEEAKKKALELLNRNRLSEEQIDTRVNQVGNAFNTQALETLNNQAFGINGMLNSDTARTLASAKLASQKAMAEVQTREQLYNQNSQVNSQIAQISGTPIQSPTTGEVIGGAINTGLQAFSAFQGIENQNKYLDELKKLKDSLNQLPNEIVKNNIPIFNDKQLFETAKTIDVPNLIDKEIEQPEFQKELDITENTPLMFAPNDEDNPIIQKKKYQYYPNEINNKSSSNLFGISNRLFGGR